MRQSQLPLRGLAGMSAGPAGSRKEMIPWCFHLERHFSHGKLLKQ